MKAFGGARVSQSLPATAGTRARAPAKDPAGFALGRTILARVGKELARRRETKA